MCTDIAWRAIISSDIDSGRHLAIMVKLRAYVHKIIGDTADVVLKHKKNVIKVIVSYNKTDVS